MILSRLCTLNNSFRVLSTFFDLLVLGKSAHMYCGRRMLPFIAALSYDHQQLKVFCSLLVLLDFLLLASMLYTNTDYPAFAYT